MDLSIELCEISHADASDILEWEGTDEYLRFLPFQKHWMSAEQQPITTVSSMLN